MMNSAFHRIEFLQIIILIGGINMIGERIQYLRNERGMTQQELATAINVSLKTIQFYEQERNIPDTEMIIRIARFFNVSSDYILGLINKPISLDERKKNENNELHIPMEIVKIKAARDTYKTFVDYLKYTYKDK